MTELSTNYLRLCNEQNAKLYLPKADPSAFASQDTETSGAASLELLDLWKAIPTGEHYIQASGVEELSAEERSRAFKEWVEDHSLDTIVLRNWAHNTLPKELQYCTQLRKLDFHSTTLTEIPALIFSLPQLQVLTISSPLTSVSSQICRLSHLQELSIQGGSIHTLPDEICQLPLVVLNVSHNQLTSLPERIGNLAQLKKLDATKNCITDLPASLGNCSCLEVLHLSWNQLPQIPDPIWKLPKLRSLWCGDNQLSLLPHLDQPSSVQTCHLDGNHLNAIPQEFFQQLPHLKKLYLRNNPLQNIPDVSQWNLEEIVY